MKRVKQTKIALMLWTAFWLGGCCNDHMLFVILQGRGSWAAFSYMAWWPWYVLRFSYYILTGEDCWQYYLPAFH